MCRENTLWVKVAIRPKIDCARASFFPANCTTMQKNKSKSNLLQDLHEIIEKEKEEETQKNEKLQESNERNEKRAHNNNTWTVKKRVKKRKKIKNKKIIGEK